MARAAWKTLLFQDLFPTNSKSYRFLLGTDRSICTVIDFLCEIQRKAERLLPLPGIPASTGCSLSGQSWAGTARIPPLPHPSRGTGGSPFLAAATARRGQAGTSRVGQRVTVPLHGRWVLGRPWVPRPGPGHAACALRGTGQGRAGMCRSGPLGAHGCQVHVAGSVPVGRCQPGPVRSVPCGAGGCRGDALLCGGTGAVGGGGGGPANCITGTSMPGEAREDGAPCPAPSAPRRAPGPSPERPLSAPGAPR